MGINLDSGQSLLLRFQTSMMALASLNGEGGHSASPSYKIRPRELKFYDEHGITSPSFIFFFSYCFLPGLFPFGYNRFCLQFSHRRRGEHSLTPDDLILEKSDQLLR